MANIKSTPKLNLFDKNTLLKPVSIKHPKLQKVFRVIGDLDCEIPKWNTIDDAVLYAVIGQMLSVQAARSIIQRLIQKFGSSSNVIAWASKSSSRTGPVNGVSYRKRKALVEWSKYALNKKNFKLRWRQMNLEDYRAEICSIWGFGRWASDMLAIFYIGRQDVWPESDAGIKKACKFVFGNEKHGEIKNCIKGYETVVSLYLWELLNRKLQRNI